MLVCDVTINWALHVGLPPSPNLRPSLASQPSPLFLASQSSLPPSPPKSPSPSPLRPNPLSPPLLPPWPPFPHSPSGVMTVWEWSILPREESWIFIDIHPVCMCVCVRAYVYVHACAHAAAAVWIRVHCGVRAGACVRVYMGAGLRACVHASVQHLCMLVCTRVHVNACPFVLM